MSSSCVITECRTSFNRVQPRLCYCTEGEKKRNSITELGDQSTQSWTAEQRRDRVLLIITCFHLRFRLPMTGKKRKSPPEDTISKEFLTEDEKKAKHIAAEGQRRRHARLESNRKAARESRRRKKVLVEELQRSVLFFTKANANLKAKNEQLERLLSEARARVDSKSPANESDLVAKHEGEPSQLSQHEAKRVSADEEATQSCALPVASADPLSSLHASVTGLNGHLMAAAYMSMAQSQAQALVPNPMLNTFGFADNMNPFAATAMLSQMQANNLANNPQIHGIPASESKKQDGNQHVVHSNKQRR
mmetsp:Transcript_32125/g.72852  ORF Transcript_32125/g.72852 Transcript_32125/m.72852 type:complete len:306 (-) Transcript_32125:127-1044(-)